MYFQLGQLLLENAVFAASVLILAVPFALYKYLFPSSDYWEKQGIPCYNPGFIRSWLDSLREDLHVMEQELYEKYGKVYGRYDGRTPVLIVGDVDALKEIIVTNFQSCPNRRYFQVGNPVMDHFLSALNDEDWRRVRHVLTPSFTTLKLKHMFQKANNCIEQTMKSLEIHAANDTPADLQKLFGAYTMDMIASCAFGTKINALESPDDPFVKHATKFSEPKMKLSATLVLFCPILLKLFHIPLFDTESSKFFKRFVLDIIEARSVGGEPGVDFLRLLQGALRTKDAKSPAKAPGSKDIVKYVTEDELISQCVMFFFAGYDTVTSLLQVIAHHLAADQNMQDKLYQEIVDVLEEESPTFDALSQMKYLEDVVKEGLRLTSSCIRMERQAKRNFRSEKLGVSIKEGMLISIPFYCIHYDKDNFPDPEKFDPMRFSSGIDSDNFLPFGLGHRKCIGQRFAQMEVKVLLIAILRRFRLVADMPGPWIRRVKLGQLVPDKVTVRVQRRED